VPKAKLQLLPPCVNNYLDALGESVGSQKLRSTNSTTESCRVYNYSPFRARQVVQSPSWRPAAIVATAWAPPSWCTPPNCAACRLAVPTSLRESKGIRRTGLCVPHGPGRGKYSISDSTDFWVAGRLEMNRRPCVHRYGDQLRTFFGVCAHGNGQFPTSRQIGKVSRAGYAGPLLAGNPDQLPRSELS
jgi:hypothetical protein